jgi:hypothetical protein
MNNTTGNDEVKLFIAYLDLKDNPQVESVWAEKVGNNYRIVNIPFFAYNLAYGDIVAANTETDGNLWFDELITASGHSTIQLIIMDDKVKVSDIGEQLVKLGCDWEGSHIPTYMSIDVPADLSYKPIREFLMQGRDAGKWDFKEACLAQKY